MDTKFMRKRLTFWQRALKLMQHTLGHSNCPECDANLLRASRRQH